MERIVVNVEQLLLWNSNPRTQKTATQEDELRNIYSNQSGTTSAERSKSQLMKLAESIAENGYQSEVNIMFVMQEKGNATPQKYVVHDGNRRLSAIKLLTSVEQYKEILDPRDYEKIKGLTNQYQNNIPTKMEVLLFADSEEDKLKDIIQRVHGGAMDGAGTISWSPEAQARFFEKETLTDKLEKPFQKEYGNTLTAYISGGKPVTSTRRLFSFKCINEYIAVKDPDNPTKEELGRVKEIADSAKRYVDVNDELLSRLTAKKAKKCILDPIIRNNASKTSSINSNFKMTPKMKQDLRDCKNSPGFKYVSHVDWFDFDEETFQNVNYMICALAKYGDLPVGNEQRMLKSFLIAPSVRVIFELTLEAAANCDVPLELEPGGVSTNHQTNVSKLEKLFTQNHFITYLCNKNIISSSFKELKTILQSQDFSQTVHRSQLTSHKSMKYSINENLINMFDDAMLFVILTEQLALFYKTPEGKSELAKQK